MLSNGISDSEDPTVIALHGVRVLLTPRVEEAGGDDEEDEGNINNSNSSSRHRCAT